MTESHSYENDMGLQAKVALNCLRQKWIEFSFRPLKMPSIQCTLMQRLNVPCFFQTSRYGIYVGGRLARETHVAKKMTCRKHVKKLLLLIA